MSRHALKTRRSIRRPAMRAVVAISTSMVVAASVLTVGAVTRSDASWTDSEHTADSAGVVDCAAANGAFTTRGEGRMVSGSILGTDTDAAAAVSGMLVTNDGVSPQPQPSGADHANDGAGGTDPNAFVHPLDATTFGGINVDLGPGGMVDLASILQLPLDNSTGVLNQYGRAASDGTSAAGSGLVTDSGAVAAADAGGGYPDLGSIDLKTLVAAVNPDVAASLNDIAAAQLTVGAVSGRESMDGCAAAFNSPASALTREYLIAGLGAKVSSGTVGALVTGLTSAVDGVETAVNTLAGNSGVLSNITSNVNTVLSTALNGSTLLKLGSAAATVSATIDLSSVRSILTTRFGDTAGLVSVDPNSGTVSIDIAALLGTAYPGQYSNELNGMAPNSRLLLDATATNALSVALASAIDDWVSQIQTALTSAVNRAVVKSHVSVDLTAHVCVVIVGCLDTPLGSLTADVTGSLQSLLAGTAPVTTNLVLLGGIDLAAFPGVGSLVSALTAALAGNLATIVGSAVNGALSTPLATVGTTAATLAAPIVNAIGGLFTSLFANQVVTLDVNAQNDPIAGNAQPSDWAEIPAGQYDVAALRMGILDAEGASNVNLYLGRASVGVTCSVAGCVD
jgi:hypothetical protein